MEFITAIINAYGVQIIGAIFTALAGVVGLALKNLATKYINTEIKRSVARTVVRGVEQIYRDIHGEEKLAKALEAAASMLKEYGIYTTDTELRILIESAVGEFNDVFKSTVFDGINVDDMTDDQLRSVLQQMGFAYTDNMTREEMLASLYEDSTE